MSRTRVLRIGGVLSLAALALAAAGLTLVNAERASGWQHRAEALGRSVRELRRLLGARTAALDRRTRQANALVEVARRARSQLRRSENDVASLEARQRQLANEKAQVEDERSRLREQASALEDVAAEYVTCNSGLVDLVNATASPAWSYAASIVVSVAADCRDARASLSAYLATYG